MPERSIKESLRPAPGAKSILTEDPRGRMDVAIVRLAETTCKQALGPVGRAAWDHGLGEIVEAIVIENGVPSKPVTAVDIARAAGLLPARPKKIGGRR